MERGVLLGSPEDMQERGLTNLFPYGLPIEFLEIILFI